MYARILTMRPHATRSHDVEETVRDLMAAYMQSDGCFFQGSTSVEEDGTLVAMGLWRDRVSAAAASSDRHCRALEDLLATLCVMPPAVVEHDLRGGLRTTLRSAAPLDIPGDS